jgi:hypothetical protein
MRQKYLDGDIKGLCERTDQHLKATKDRLREGSAEFKQMAARLAPSRSAAATKIDELLSGPDWSRVFLAGPLELAPWTGSEERVALLSFQWPEVDSGPLRSALKECHRAFVALDRAYHLALGRLPEKELQELFPDGAPKP